MLSGIFTSDPIEDRFGWYHQVNDNNFFISVKLLFEAEKKVHTLSLMQKKA